MEESRSNCCTISGQRNEIKKKENWNDKEYMHNSFFDTFIREYQKKKNHFSTSKFHSREEKWNEESSCKTTMKKKKTNSFSLIYNDRNVRQIFRMKKKKKKKQKTVRKMIEYLIPVSHATR